MASSTSLTRAILSVTLMLAPGVAPAQEKAPAQPAASPAAPVQPAAPQPPPPSAAQGAPQGGQPASGWTVACAGKDLACKASQSIVLAKTRQLLIGVSLSRPQGGKDLALLLHLPHGLYNPAGAVIGVDDAATATLEIQTCDLKGCYAGSTLPPDKVAALTKGTSLKVTFQDLKKQKITVPVPLKGLDEALKKL
jgi:invasion protein IalB